MTRAISGVAALAALLTVTSLAGAGGSITGHWAADLSTCPGASDTPDRSLLVVTTSTMRWLDHDCRIARAYRTGETVHLQVICQTASGKRSVPVSLRPHHDRLLVHWDRSYTADLQRCR